MSGSPPRIRALLFDFDGLIVDTETPSHESWNEIYREFGHELDLELWADVISNRESTFDALANLQSLLGGRALDADALNARRNARKEALTDEAAILPGIHGYINDARVMGLRLGIASGSSRAWVTRHLERLGLAGGWDAIVCRDDVARSKPYPDSYNHLLDRLRVRPKEAIALEDSPNGIRAARAAGIFCVAVPNSLTARLDLGGADLVVASLDDFPLSGLLQAFRSAVQ
jgi:HAD superfamily hydrolase (TIGR01509 family)